MKTLLQLFLFCTALAASAETLLVEAEHFENRGGWKCDTQFLHSMGSPYLLAHGLGKPVEDASHKITIKDGGRYRLFVRTFDWCARWDVKGPGLFRVAIDGEESIIEDEELPVTFGTVGKNWCWQAGGEVELSTGEHTLTLKDMTGFDGRIDCLILTSDPDFKPSNSSDMEASWREELLPKKRETKKYDIVVIGGGFTGLGTALSSARQGLRVALIQDREILGGNGSSEVRVRPEGHMPKSEYPLGDIIQPLCTRTRNAGSAKAYHDEIKLAIVRKEKNIDLYTGHFAHKVTQKGNKIASVSTIVVKKPVVRTFKAPLFADCTGHGTIGLLAGAKVRWQLKNHMGMSNMFNWSPKKSEQKFPETPWALQLTEKMFPYPRKGDWYWESGFNKHPLYDLEAVRDWNLRAVFGAWNAMKNKGAYAKRHSKKIDFDKASLDWVAYIGGTRETLQIEGDIILTKKDVVSKKKFKDGIVLTTWGLDLHYPHPLYGRYFPDNPFISRAHIGGYVNDKSKDDSPAVGIKSKLPHGGHGVDRKKGYLVPYRCFYSKNVVNLFAPGRNMSVDHDALGTVRVMKTLGMAGVACGRAARICVEKNCTPREVYTKYFELFKERLKQPGDARLPNIEK